MMKYMLSGFEMEEGFITPKYRNLVLYVDLSCNKTVENMIFILMISNLVTSLGKHVCETPLLYSKTGVCRGIPMFSSTEPKAHKVSL